MLPEEIAVGHPHAHSICHVDPFVCNLDVTFECTLYQEGVATGFLDQDKDAFMKCKVCLSGPLRHHLCGWLCICVHIECMGPGPEITVKPCCKIELDPCDKDGCYECEIKIPAGTLKAEECGQVCCFVTTVTSLDKCGNPGHIGCWCKGPCVMVHKEPQA